jgi:hypothetical protein
VIFSTEISVPVDELQRSIDHRESDEGREGILTLHVPAVATAWTADSADYSIIGARGDKRTVRAKIVARRVGSIIRLELTLVPTPSQLQLFTEDKP